MMRLFFGLALDQPSRDALWSAVSAMPIGGRLPPRENYHLTMAFLGDREERQIAPIRRIAAEAAGSSPPLLLAITGFGFFGKRESALLHAKLAPSPRLAVLADRLRGLLTAAGETFDPKPFAAHITLARQADLTDADLRLPFPPLSFTADRLTLYHSTRVEGELRYLPVFESSFRKDAQVL